MSGSPKTCGSRVVPMTSVPGEGSWPPSTKVTPPSSEYMYPETEVGLSAKPRVSLKPMTICWPVLSTAIAVSAWPPAMLSGSSSPSQSGVLMQVSGSAAPPTLWIRPCSWSAARAFTASRPMWDIRSSGAFLAASLPPALAAQPAAGTSRIPSRLRSNAPCFNSVLELYIPVPPLVLP